MVNESLLIQWAKQETGEYDVTSVKRRAITVKREGKVVKEEEY